jgi:hypothetical protein
VDDDRHYILEDEPVSCYLITRVEELIYLGVLSLKHHAILLRQGVECGLDGVVLIEVRFVDIGASFIHS